MNLGRCPHCHLPLDLAHLVSDDAASQVLRIVVAAGDDARPLLAYVGLWRPAKRDLSWDRTLKLLTEVQAMLAGIDRQAACEALSATVQGIRDKGGQLPITSHGYLKKVLDAVERRPVTEVQELVMQQAPAPAGPRSKTMKALEVLEAMKRGRS
jgi:hypothetical protein